MGLIWYKYRRKKSWMENSKIKKVSFNKNNEISDMKI